MKRAVVALSCWALLAAGAAGQSDGDARPDAFRGVILDKTTVEGAIDLLGPPAEDRVDKLDVSKLGKWLDPKHREKIFRRLTFRKVGDFKSVRLSFLDGKLVMIDIEYPRSFKLETLRALFDVDFIPIGFNSELPDEPGQYPNPYLPYPYTHSYGAVNISRRAFIWANFTSSTVGVPTGIERTRQISRALEKR